MKSASKSLPLVISLLLSLNAFASVFYVSDTNDSTAVTCLRGAVIAANHAGGKNTIWLWNRSNHPTYSLTISGADESAGLTGDLKITRGNLTIVGYTTNVTIDATELGDRVFQVSRGASLTLENLIITGGNPTGLNDGTNIDGESGGAIYNLGTLDIQNCIFAGNSSQNAPASGSAGNGGDGGAIYNVGNLTMSRCVIMQNICGTGANDQNEGGGGNGGNGGAICNLGQMDLAECVITGNSSGQGRDAMYPPNLLWIILFSWAGNGGDGGGICNYGKANLDFCTISDNAAGIGGNNFGGGGGTGGNGGGIFNAGELIAGTSTISSNTCGNGGDGGGLFGGAGGMGGGGGGIFNSASNMVLSLKSSFLKLTSTTVTLNLCGAGGNGGNSLSLVQLPNSAPGGDGGNGGGVLNNADAAAVVVRNTLIAQNLVNSGGLGGTNTTELFSYGQPPQYVIQAGDPGTNGIGFDVCGNFSSKGFNLIGTGDGNTGFDNGVKTDQVGTDANMIDPLLGPLQMNGGFTPTHALLWRSPAIDQGNCFGVHRDQRGRHRPYNYPSIRKPAGGDNSDIGAFELDNQGN